MIHHAKAEPCRIPRGTATQSAAMKIADARRAAMALPEVTEEPHFNYASFRVKGKIFVTVPPEETHLHVFVGDDEREQALAMYPGFAEKLLWGGKVVGLRIALASATPSVVKALMQQAWARKAPKALLAGLPAAAKPSNNPSDNASNKPSSASPSTAPKKG